MGRISKPEKPLIYVFCEGESEQAYAAFLKKKFQDVAVIKIPRKPGLFKEAEIKFQNDARFANYLEVTDEIWFFFDVEASEAEMWEARLRIINKLRKMRKKPNIGVRLLMTTGCLEYWLMLHYKYYTPPLNTVADKEKVMIDLKHIMPQYEKGNQLAIERIAEKYPTALMNAEQTLKRLIREGLPTETDTDERNRWLCTSCKTFSNVHEAILFLERLSKR